MSCKRLLDNAKKSINKLWSQQNIDSYRADLNLEITKNPELIYDPVFGELQSILNLQQSKRNFLALPEYFQEDPDKTNKNLIYKVYRPILPKMSNFNLPPPEKYKESDNWATWSDNLESYFHITKITEDKDKIELLLYLIGLERRNKLVDYIKPETTSDKDYTFTKLKESCTKLWQLSDSRQALASVFNTNQGSDKVYDYAMKIKNLCAKANITDQMIIVNKFITGLYSHKIKFELLKDDKITDFSTALKQAQLLEKIIEGDKPSTSQVNKVGGTKPKKSNKKFNNKNKSNKFNKNNPPNNQKEQNSKQNQRNFAKNQCFACKNYGHWKWQCPNRNQNDRNYSKTNEVKDISQELGSLSFEP